MTKKYIKKTENRGWFKKGEIGFWKGKKRPDISKIMSGRTLSLATRKKLSEAHKGYHHSLSTRKKMSETHKRLGTKPPPQLAEKNVNWKGENVGYRALHHWITKRLGTPKKCENCGRIKTTPKSIHWANKSHKYTRKLNDWLSLCASCHKLYDTSFNSN